MYADTDLETHILFELWVVNRLDLKFRPKAAIFPVLSRSLSDGQEIQCVIFTLAKQDALRTIY